MSILFQTKNKLKKLIMIAGPAGIGKTTVCKRLFRTINGCAWLDGDWCWMVNPYPGKNDDQKKYSLESFGRILDGYFNDANTRIILFSWMIQWNFMFELVTNNIPFKNYDVIKIALVCEENVFKQRLINGNRSENKIHNLDDMGKYRSLNATIIDTTNLSVCDTANRIMSLINQ
jgi:broad-specificity NMP kinase